LHQLPSGQWSGRRRRVEQTATAPDRHYAFRKNATGEESYIGMTSRSCASNAAKCGSPGKHIWIDTKSDPDPPFGPMNDYCTSGLDCKLK